MGQYPPLPLQLEGQMWFIKTDTYRVSKQYSVRTDVTVGKRVYNDVTIFTKSNSDYNILKFGTHFAEQSVYQAQNLTELYSCIFGCLC
jgi:hypothetical protein